MINLLSAEMLGESFRAVLDTSREQVVDLAGVAPHTSVMISPKDNGTDFRITARSPWKSDLHLSVEIPVADFEAVIFPLATGQLESHHQTGKTFEYRGPGWSTGISADRRLALPVAFLRTNTGLYLLGTDPHFTTRILLANDEKGGQVTARIDWTYRNRAGQHSDVIRSIFWEECDDYESGLARCFALATPDVPPAPPWLHDIALVNYDYMSKNGRGWFDDIDAACKFIAEKDRHRALFTLHGWYDTVGRYCLDPQTGELDTAWTVFPFAQDERFLAREFVQEPGRPQNYTFRNLSDYRPLDMNWDDIRRRLQYARDRGIRTAFYVMCGMMDMGSSQDHIAAGSGLDGPAVLWIGPDAVGDAYLMNPLNPAVRTRILTLMRKLLDAVGDLTDAFVFDEAYYIGYGDLGPDAYPGYADLAQATLLRDMAALCHEHDPHIAFLTADHIGTPIFEGRAFPYSLYADGIFHDAWSQAQPFDAARFPTWRSVVFSCNWAPVSELANTRWSVIACDAPVAVSNGCFGDDVGLADMDDPSFQAISDLWRIRVSRTRAKSISLADQLTS